MSTPLIRTTVHAAVLVMVFALSSLISYSQYTCEDYVGTNGATVKWNPTRQRIVTNQNVPGTTLIRNWLEFLPDDYNSTNKKYPLLVFFHGVNEGGNGTPCRLLESEWWWTPPVIIERNQFPYSTKDPRGNAQKFIVISPRVEYYSQSTSTINAFLDHLIRTYRVDPTRIYLTGISAGTHFILDYVSQSPDNGRRLAGLLPISPCWGGLQDWAARNISEARLHVLAINCSYDHCGGGSDQAKQIADAINRINPSLNLGAYAALPTAGRDCLPTEHDAWGIAYDSAFRPNINGRNMNVYEWMLQYSTVSSGPLPVALENYSVQLSNGKVYVRWATSAEQNSHQFTIERAGQNQAFTAIGTVPAAGSSTTVKTYEWVDEGPLPDVNYYRLTQTDLDGKKQVFTVKKILNRNKWDRHVVASPNPFGEQLTVYINVDKIQRVNFTLLDASGRTVQAINGTYNEGTAEVVFDGKKLPRGIYTLKIEGQFFSEVQRVVKQ